MKPPGGPVRLIFIASMGRSGSTLLDRLLGGVDGWWSMGEVLHVWQRGVVDNELCGCGVPFLQCPFWSDVGRVAFGGWTSLDIARVRHLHRRVERDRFIPLLLRPSLSPRFQSRLTEYQGLLGCLYRAIAEVTAARVLVDSGKHVPAALVLRTNPHVDLTILHLVRDSRGVAFSWSKVRTRPETGHAELMARWSPMEVALRYSGYNLLLDRLDRDRTSILRVRYEDLVKSPHHALSRLQEAMGDELGPASGDWLNTADFPANHMIGGNPMRFATGKLQMSVDEEWKTAMSSSSRRLVTSVTYPLLLRYGYTKVPSASLSAREPSRRP